MVGFPHREELAHHVELRHVGADAVTHRGDALLGQDLGVEARAVVVPDDRDLPAHGLAAHGGAVDRQVASLGVAAHHDGGRHVPAGDVEVGGRVGLRRHHVVGHLEVLAPSHDRVVGAPEGHVGGPVRQPHVEDAELLAAACVEPGVEAPQAGVAEPPAGRQFLREQDRVGRDHAGPAVDLFLAVDLEEALGRLGHGHGPALGDRGHHALQGAVGQLRQHDVVHLVEGHGLQGHVPVPVEIVENVCHAPSLALLVVLMMCTPAHTLKPLRSLPWHEPQNECSQGGTL